MNYRKLWEQHHGPIPKDEYGRTYDIHHIDGNRKNNSLDNLVCLSIEDHYKIHLKQFEETKSEKEFASLVFLSKRMNRTIESLTGWTRSDETKEKIRQFKNNLVILYEKEMKPYLNYVIDKYGKDFIKLYEQ